MCRRLRALDCHFRVQYPVSRNGARPTVLAPARNCSVFWALFFSLEPAVCQTKLEGDSSLWITADGPLPDEKLEISSIVPSGLPIDAFVHYLYSSSTSSFIVLGAKNATFSWRNREATCS